MSAGAPDEPTTKVRNGLKLELLTIVDEWAREYLAIEVAARIDHSRVLEVLARLMSLHGRPASIRRDDGSEFVARRVKDRMKKSGVESAYIEAGKPRQNATNESFNVKLRDECLNMDGSGIVRG